MSIFEERKNDFFNRLINSSEETKMEVLSIPLVYELELDEQLDLCEAILTFSEESEKLKKQIIEKDIDMDPKYSEMVSLYLMLLNEFSENHKINYALAESFQRFNNWKDEKMTYESIVASTSERVINYLVNNNSAGLSKEEVIENLKLLNDKVFINPQQLALKGIRNEENRQEVIQFVETFHNFCEKENMSLIKK